MKSLANFLLYHLQVLKDMIYYTKLEKLVIRKFKFLLGS